MRYVPQRLLFGLVLAAGFLVLSPPRASAAGCNLDAGAGYDCAFNGGLFDVVGPHPTGTGVIDSFLRVQMKGTEQAFNSDFRPITCDGVECESYKTDPNYTRDLLTSSIPIFTDASGNKYLTFFLDVNEASATPKQFITLDQLKIYGSDTGDLGAYTTAGGVIGATKLFDLDNGSDNWINLDYNLIGGGSGSGDMVAYIPIKTALDYDYIYLFSQFGCSSNCGNGASMNANKKYASGAGFEEWWVKNSNGGGGGGPLTPVPEPGTFALLATGMAIAARKRRRNRNTTQS